MLPRRSEAGSVGGFRRLLVPGLVPGDDGTGADRLGNDPGNPLSPISPSVAVNRFRAFMPLSPNGVVPALLCSPHHLSGTYMSRT